MRSKTNPYLILLILTASFAVLPAALADPEGTGADSRYAQINPQMREIFIPAYLKIQAQFPRDARQKDPAMQEKYLAAISQAFVDAHVSPADGQMWMSRVGFDRHDAPAAPGNGATPQHDEPPELTPPQQAASDLVDARARTNPDDPDVLRRRADIRSYQHDWRGAFDDLNKVVAGGNPDAQTLTALSGAAYHLGDYQTAASAAQRALQLDPKNQEALALYHFSKDRSPTVSLPSALGDLGATTQGPGGMPPGAAGAQGATAQGAVPTPSGMTSAQVAQALQQAAAGGAATTARSAQYARDAANAMRLGDYNSAYRLATQAVQLNPSNAQALNFRAIALTRMGRSADAVQDASAALALAPGSAAALQTRANALAKLGRYADALKDAEATLAADPSNAYAWQNKAFALAGLGDRSGTLDALRRSAAADPRFQNQLERALRLPQDADLRLLFDEAPGAAAAAAGAAPSSAPASSRPGRFLRLMILTVVGGLLIALAVLHVVSASWREKVNATVRRAIGGSSPVAAGAPVAPGSGAFWTQYELVKEIGLGGMGVVYEAKDRSLERRVAVKRMRDEIRLDAQDRQRFVNEARLVAQLHHPNIVDIYGIVEDGGEVYLVFEFVEGRTLADVLKSDGALGFGPARRVLKEMAAAVEHAHGRGVIHRDLKPSNVMVAPDGRVKVMDFGVARQAKDAMTRHSSTSMTIAGTPPYMAPEHEQGSARKESDVYALGVCFYEMLTGQLPFGGIGAGMLLNKLNGRLTPASRRVPSLPAGIDEVIAKALAPDPAQRYRTPAEFVDALDALAAARAA